MNAPAPDNPNLQKFDETRFYPSGAIAFFSLMLTSFIIGWLLVYALMIHRA